MLAQIREYRFDQPMQCQNKLRDRPELWWGTGADTIAMCKTCDNFVWSDSPKVHFIEFKLILFFFLLVVCVGGGSGLSSDSAIMTLRLLSHGFRLKKKMNLITLLYEWRLSFSSKNKFKSLPHWLARQWSNVRT